MTIFTATVYVNVGEDNFFGYTPTSPLAEVDYPLTVHAETPLSAAEAVFAIANRMATTPAHPGGRLQVWPSDVRSLSVGDLVRLRAGDGTLTFFSVDSFGWTEVPEPTNPIVPLAGTYATSRV